MSKTTKKAPKAKAAPKATTAKKTAVVKELPKVTSLFRKQNPAGLTVAVCKRGKNPAFVSIFREVDAKDGKGKRVVPQKRIHADEWKWVLSTGPAVQKALDTAAKAEVKAAPKAKATEKKTAAPRKATKKAADKEIDIDDLLDKAA